MEQNEENSHKSKANETLQCDYCNYTSKHKSNMTSHMKGEHSTVNTRFKCCDCGKKYKKNSYLKGHVKKKHETLSEKKALIICSDPVSKQPIGEPMLIALDEIERKQVQKYIDDCAERLKNPKSQEKNEAKEMETSSVPLKPTISKEKSQSKKNKNFDSNLKRFAEENIEEKLSNAESAALFHYKISALLTKSCKTKTSLQEQAKYFGVKQ